MKKRFLSLALCLCMVLTLLPTMALAEGKSSVTLGDVIMSAAAGTPSYWKSGNTEASSAEISGWNAKFELVDGVPTLTLRDADTTFIDFSAGTLNIVVSGENTVKGSVSSEGSLHISGSGKLTVNDSSGRAISAKDIVITGNELEVEANEAGSTGGISCGIMASVSISIDGAKVTATGGDMSGSTSVNSYGISVDGTGVSITNGARVTARGGKGGLSGGSSAGIQLYYTSSADPVALSFADAQVSAVGSSAASSYGIYASLYQGEKPISLSVSGGSLIAQCDTTATEHEGIYLNGSESSSPVQKAVTLTSGALVGANSIGFNNTTNALTVGTDCTLITETVGNAGTFTNNGTSLPYGGDVSAAQLNLYAAPKVKTGYLAGGGWAIWEPTVVEGTVTSGRLTLEDFVCSTNISGGKALFLPNLPGDIALELFGTNSLTATAVSGKALNAPIYGSLSVSGTGSLTLNGGACGLSYNGVADGASLTIGGSASITANSIYSNSQINVDSGTLNCPNVYTGADFVNNAGTVNALVTEGQDDIYNTAVFSVYGDVTLAADTTIYDKSAGDGLTVTDGATLTIPAGKTLTVQDGTETGVPQITNSGAIVNNGTIVLPATYAADVPAAIKALGLTGSGTVKMGATVYTNAGSRVLGALAFTDETGATGDLDADGYHYEVVDGVGTLTLDNAAVISTGASGISFTKEPESAMTFAIVLVGQNSVSNSGSGFTPFCSGIYSSADLTISGEGTLDVSASSACNRGDCYGICTADEGDVTINSNVTAFAASGDTLTENHNYGISSDGDLTVGKSRTVTAAAGNADGGSEGIDATGNLRLENGAVVTASSGDTTSGGSTGVYGYADLTLDEGARLSATAGRALNSSEYAYHSTGVYLDGAVSLGTDATLEATGADARGEGASSYGLYIGGLTVGEGASVTAKSGSAETTRGISNYGADINVAGGTVKATAGDAAGTDSYSFGIDATNCDMIVSGAGTVDASGGKAINSVGIELSQGRSYDPDTGVTTYYDNGKLILSDSAKVTAKSGDPASVYPGSVGLGCAGLSLSDSASLDAQGVNYGIRAAGFSGKDENGVDTLSPAAISVSDSASLSAAAKSAAFLSFGLQGCAAVDVSGGTAKFAGNTAAVYLYGASDVTVGSGLTAVTTPAGGTLKSASTVAYQSYTAESALTVNETTGVPTNACTAVTICALPAPVERENFTCAITANGSASATVKVGETVHAALTLTCNTGSSFRLYAMQDYVKFDPAYFSLDESSIQVYQDIGSGAPVNIFCAAPRDFGSGVNQIYVNRASTSPVTLGKTVTVMTFELKALKAGSTTLTHDAAELSDSEGGQYNTVKTTAAITIQNSSDGGNSGGSGTTAGGSGSGTTSGGSGSGTASGGSGTASDGGSSETASGSNSSGTISGGTAANPHTGDSSNMFLLVVLLFVSGGVLTTLGIRKRRSKVNSK